MVFLAIGAYLFIGVLVTMAVITVMAWLDVKEEGKDFEDMFDEYIGEIGSVALCVLIWPFALVTGLVIGLFLGLRWLIFQIVNSGKVEDE